MKKKIKINKHTAERGGFETSPFILQIESNKRGVSIWEKVREHRYGCQHLRIRAHQMIDERLLYLSLYRYMMRSAKGNCTMTLKATDFQGPQRDKKSLTTVVYLTTKIKIYPQTYNCLIILWEVIVKNK